MYTFTGSKLSEQKEFGAALGIMHLPGTVPEIIFSRTAWTVCMQNG